MKIKLIKFWSLSLGSHAYYKDNKIYYLVAQKLGHNSILEQPQWIEP